MSTKAILLVEDDPDHRALTQHALSSGDVIAAVVPVRDGDEALDYIFCRGGWAGRDLAASPALVLLDLKLVSMDGIEVLRQIREDARTRSIPVVVLTCSNETSDIARCYEAGANGFVRKPANFDEFRDALRATALFWLDFNVPLPPQR